MAVSLDKEYGIPFGGFLSAEMQDQYNTYKIIDHINVVFDDHGPMLNRHLAHNCLNGFAALIMYRDHFNNVTGELEI
jgi:hypothetical protein